VNFPQADFSTSLTLLAHLGVGVPKRISILGIYNGAVQMYVLDL
jgi:hypothetical protein